MKASDLIKQLQEKISTYGDLDICLVDMHDNGSNTTYFSVKYWLPSEYGGDNCLEGKGADDGYFRIS